MRITEVMFERKKNLGNYEHTIAKVSLALDEKDDGVKALEFAQSVVDTHLGLQAKKVVPTVEKEETPAPAPAPAKEEVKAEAPKKEAKATKTKKEEPKEEVVYTKDQVNSALANVARKFGSKDKAVALLKEVGGADKLDNVDPSKYADIIKASEKCLK